jgi:hypothetical protein
MTVNVSYLKAHKILKENMWLTAKPLYKNIDIEWEDMCKLVSSDYIQYSPYKYKDRIKKGINWSNENQDLLIFDIDSHMSISEASKVFGRFLYLLTTTKSHGVLKQGIICDRFRLILPAKNIPTEEDVYFTMLEVMRSQVPAIDPQPNNKSGAFLGNGTAECFYNDGDIYDCSKAVEVARYRILNEKKVKQKISENKIEYTNGFNLNVKDLKSSLTIECLMEILEKLGYELEGNKFKLRDERTPSCTIFNDCELNDFGGNFKGDIFDLLMRYHDMSFRDALNYVNNFIRSKNG